MIPNEVTICKLCKELKEKTDFKLKLEFPRMNTCFAGELSISSVQSKQTSSYCKPLQAATNLMHNFISIYLVRTEPASLFVAQGKTKTSLKVPQQQRN